MEMFNGQQNENLLDPNGDELISKKSGKNFECLIEVCTFV